MISVTILTKNSARHLEEVLLALKNFDEVLVYDTGSEDETLSIARKCPNVKIVEGPFVGFGKTHNQASALTKNEWVLSIDSDEILSEELQKRLATLELQIPHVP